MSEASTDDARAAVERIYRAESRRVLATLIRLLGPVEIAEQANERGEHAAGLGAIDPFDGGRRVLGARLAHDVIGARLSRVRTP